MKLIRSSHSTRYLVPPTAQAGEASGAWFSTMGDRIWRALIDFRNWPMWLPALQSAEPLDNESPARGTRLKLVRARRQRHCSIDHWDPPHRLHFSFAVVGGEIAYGFTIRKLAEQSELLITLELERSIHGPILILTPLLRWRLRTLAASSIDRLRRRIRPL